MRNNLRFGGVNSVDYGVYITGSGVYNAPKRAVENIVIPGRNGLLTIDQGRYENITIEYPAFAFGKSRKEFRQKINSFRNAILSLTGYQRLEDTYHPDEYRLAIYEESFDVDVGPYGGSGRFTLRFNCKPQRFLKEGEHPIELEDGNFIINPTQHDSEPLAIVNGYGDIGIGDYNIHIDDVQVGRISVSDIITVQNQDLSRSWNINEAQYNSGDHVVINGLVLRTTFVITSSATYLDSAQPDRIMGIEYYNTVDSDAALSYSKSGKTVVFEVTVPAVELTIGQNKSLIYRMRATINVQANGQWQSNRCYFVITIGYTNGILTVYAERLLFNASGELSLASPQESCNITMGNIAGDSTLSILDDTIYIDCEIGEVYTIRGGAIAPLNSIVNLGSGLPKLKPGENEISLSGTVDGFQIIPRWWQI